MAPNPPAFTSHDWPRPGRGFSSAIVARLYFLRPGGSCARLAKPGCGPKPPAGEAKTKATAITTAITTAAAI